MECRLSELGRTNEFTVPARVFGRPDGASKRFDSRAMTAALSRFLRTDWFGPLIIIVAASIGISIFDPSFLSPFNIQILLLAASVNCLIAMSQMVIIAVGQMNLAIGEIGGLSAICFAGLMQVWGFPGSRRGGGSRDRRRRGSHQRLSYRAHPHFGVHHHARQASRSSRARISASRARNRSTASPRA